MSETDTVSNFKNAKVQTMIKGYLKLIVLKELMQDSLTGYEIMQKLEAIMGKKPSSGTMYPLLKELHEKKFISQKDDDNKKFYKITVKGKRLVERLISEREEMMVRRAAFLDSARGVLSEKEHKELVNAEKRHKSKSQRMEFIMFNHIMPLKGSIMKALSLKREGVEEKVMRIIDDAKTKIDKIASKGDSK